MSGSGNENASAIMQPPSGDFTFSLSAEQSASLASLAPILSQANVTGQQGDSNNDDTISASQNNANSILLYRPAPMCGKRKAPEDTEERNVRPKLHFSQGLADSQFAVVDDDVAREGVTAEEPAPEPQEQNLKDEDLDDGKMAGVPLIKLLYGPRLPKDPSAHAKEFVGKIVVKLQKMNQAEVKAGLKKGGWPRGLVTKGCTVEYMRLEYDLRSGTGLKKRPLSYIQKKQAANDATTSTESAKRIYEEVQADLHYLVCWNVDAFPELTQKNRFAKAFSPLSPGAWDTTFNIFLVTGVDMKSLNFNKPGQAAHIIYKALLRRVQAMVPDSHLLRPPPSSFDGSAMQSEIESDRCLTLAFTVENFQSALTRVIQKANAEKEKSVEQIVEAFMYKLALKEPRAFPEIFFSALINRG